ncbi:MAG: type II secretion system F family protein [Abitibacteriaceae bacterium]|nr:type II secretion system F family protein [Abditibacteriaceae bacterium]MBV9864403.1 type II secretion system F family protein [Abditibacteriaceae bacterium]
MPTFAYQARDKSGQRVSGTREASDQRAALEALREIGLFVTQLAPVGRNFRRSTPAHPQPPATMPSAAPAPAVSIPTPLAVEVAAPVRREVVAPVEMLEAPALPREQVKPREGFVQEQVELPGPQSGSEYVPPVPRVPVGVATPEYVSTQPWMRANAKEMALFFRQMNSMLNAGTGLSQALHTMSTCASNSSLRRACLDMSSRTSKGQPWSETLQTYPGIFSKLAIGMISAGEKGGFLDRMCLRLSEYAERDYALQQTVKRETWYPKLLVLSSIFIPSAVPFVVTWYMGTGNPFLAWLRSVLPPLLIIGLAWGGWKLINYLSPVTLHSGSPRYIVDRIKLSTPIMGKTVRALATAKFCRALSALYAAGMGLSRTLNLAADTTGNAVLTENVRQIIPRVEQGESLSECLASTGYFSPIVLQMLRTGEMSGSIDTQLDKVADFLETDAETTIKQSVKVLGIVAFLVIAIYIGMQVIQFYTGYFDAIFSEANKMS